MPTQGDLRSEVRRAQVIHYEGVLGVRRDPETRAERSLYTFLTRHKAAFFSSPIFIGMHHRHW
jgi:hypothetical protein